MARAAGVTKLVYLSVIHSDIYVNVPHFAGKFGVERMIEQMGFEGTILRPAVVRPWRLSHADRQQGARHDRQP
ncbi:uncharacterized protein YbjT (DUF2867 family) [Devosia sp. UYZn731]